jgi:hypothetical protein
MCMTLPRNMSRYFCADEQGFHFEESATKDNGMASSPTCLHRHRHRSEESIHRSFA